MVNSNFVSSPWIEFFFFKKNCFTFFKISAPKPNSFESFNYLHKENTTKNYIILNQYKNHFLGSNVIVFIFSIRLILFDWYWYFFSPLSAWESIHELFSKIHISTLTIKRFSLILKFSILILFPFSIPLIFFTFLKDPSWLLLRERDK